MPLCYQPNDAKRALPAPSRRADWGAPDHGPLLAAFRQSLQDLDEVFDSWCRILPVPDAHLWLLRWGTNVQTIAGSGGARNGRRRIRLAFVPMLPIERHLLAPGLPPTSTSTRLHCNAHHHRRRGHL